VTLTRKVAVEAEGVPEIEDGVQDAVRAHDRDPPLYL
jgi:hypothetical protein